VLDFKPRDYQRAIIDTIIDTPRVNVWAGMGTGKTVATLTAIDVLHNGLGHPGRTLVLAPLRVAQSTWPDEQRKWSHLQDLSVQAAIGDPRRRGEAIQGPARVVTMNYENLPWLMDFLVLAGMDWPFSIVVADEATRLKNFRLRQGGLRSRALGKVAHAGTIERWVNLTGTPAPNGLLDVWGQNWFIDAGQRLGRTFSAFEGRYFHTYRRPGQQFGGEVRLNEGSQAKIEQALSDVTVTVKASDYLDMPPLIENTIYVDLPPAARKLYKDLERDMFMTLACGAEVEVVNAATLSMKCLQVANGAAYTGEAGSQQWREIHDAKVEALRSVVEESAGAPVLVAYHFKSDLERLLAAFPHGRALDRDPDTIRQWNAGAVPVLFAHPESAGHGLNLQDGGCAIVFFGLWWNLEHHEQIIERIGPTRQAQAGHNRPVTVHRIVARKTVDELVLARLKTKASVQQLLIDAMKEKTSEQ